ncbi:MAG: integration host factor subunit alpha [Alphaproteobacteria bacterium]|nr:integration host factor subunit alpha [Alphaproteobacteria bacterium]
MDSKTLTRADLSAVVYRDLGLSLSESTQLVDAVLEEMILALEEDDSLKLSSFGTFSVRTKKQRIGRNPKTGIEVPITPRAVISFNASNILKADVNDALAKRGKK